MRFNKDVISSNGRITELDESLNSHSLGWSKSNADLLLETPRHQVSPTKKQRCCRRHKSQRKTLQPLWSIIPERLPKLFHTPNLGYRPSISTSIPLACTVCYRPNAQACSRCLSILYCDKICQVADYDYHKWLCPKYLEFKNLPRPTPGSKIGVRFLAVECREDLIWLEDEDENISEVRKDDYGSTSPILTS